MATPVHASEHAIDRYLGEYLLRREVWAARIEASKVFLRNLGVTAARHRSPRSTPVVLRRLTDRIVGRRESMSSTPVFHFTVENGLLRAWATENERLAIGAPADPALWRSPDVNMPSVQARWISVAGHRLPPEVREGVTGLLRQAAALDQVAADLLRKVRPRAVVLGTMESPWARLLLWHARARGMGTVYSAHAPVATSRSYADLPVDLALLFGPGEIEYYRTLGGSPEQALAAGSRLAAPALPIPAGPKDHLVFAGTVHRDPTETRAVLLRMQNAAREQGLRLVVAPHPREKGSLNRIAADLGLPVHGGRSSSLLATGRVVALVGEAISGLLLEGEYLDVRTAYVYGPPWYLFALDLGIPLLDDGDEISDWLGTIGDSSSGAERARHWLADVGSSAAGTGEAVLADAVISGRPFVDSWSQFA